MNQFISCLCELSVLSYMVVSVFLFLTCLTQLHVVLQDFIPFVSEEHFIVYGQNVYKIQSSSDESMSWVFLTVEYRALWKHL